MPINRPRAPPPEKVFNNPASAWSPGTGPAGVGIIATRNNTATTRKTIDSTSTRRRSNRMLA